MALGLIIVALGDARVLAREVERPVAGVLLLAGATICLAVYAGWKSHQQEERERQVEAVEKRYQEHPSEPQAAWDLARVKLELYLNRNLNHVRAVFWLALFVMSVGFFLIGIGVWQVYRAPNIIAPSVVAAISGIIVNLIGASFLVVYRSTMEQAKDYVTILERINAVGMAVQIIESIDSGNTDLKAKATADLTKQLLSLYASTAKPRIRTTSLSPAKTDA